MLNRKQVVASVVAVLTAVVLLSSSALNSQSLAAGSDTGARPRFLTNLRPGAPVEIARAYIAANRDALRLQTSDTAELVLVDQVFTNHNGVTHLYFQQRRNGIDVHNALLNVNVNADGAIISLGNRLVSHLEQAVNSDTPALSAVEAANRAVDTLGLVSTEALAVVSSLADTAQTTVLSDGGVSREPITVRLVYMPVAPGDVRLAWQVSVYTLDADNYWQLRIDAWSGGELDRDNLVIHDEFGTSARSGAGALAADATTVSGPAMANLAGDQYNVYAEPVESPNHGGRTLVTDPADATASSFGWHDTDGSPGAESNHTVGNNVDAYEDTNNSNSPTGGNSARADGGVDRHFNFPIDLGQQPSTYQDAAITNLFYWNNIVHDVLYQYGFDEAAGNFQENNYGNGGAGSDSVNAEAQDGGGTNNANFFTPSDGSNPRMQMYLWNLTTPQRDGSLDNGIIVHEYGHGVSTRLTGGPNTVTCLFNNEQMGEGWSDYFSLVFTLEAGDHGGDVRGIGTYALGQPTTGDGIRPQPYSTDFGVNNTTYADLPGQAVPHGVGFVWATMLWEMTWELITNGVTQSGLDTDIYQGTGGNNLALQLVMDGLKLQPCSPGFVDGRDAILQADMINNGGANQCAIWAAFARRGLGESASQGSALSINDGTAAFDVPAACQGPPPTNTPGPSPTATNTPGPQTCTTYDSSDVPVTLPNGVASINSMLTVPDSGTITDVNLTVDMAHEWVGDLSFILDHDTTSVTVMDRPGVPATAFGCSNDDVLATLDDDAPLPVENECAAGAPTINGTFSPNNPLSAFNGGDSQGSWTLIVTDDFLTSDSGTLNAWSLEICTEGTPPPTDTPDPTATSSPSPSATNTPTATATPSPTPSSTPVSSPTATATPSPTPSSSPTPVPSPTATPTPEPDENTAVYLPALFNQVHLLTTHHGP